MKPGTRVFDARMVDGLVWVRAGRILGEHGYSNLIRVQCGGELYDLPTRDLHATRTAALEALAERLEEEAKRERGIASEHITRAERCLIQAGQARRMVGEGSR